MSAAHSIANPCEILLPPTGHYLTSYTVYTPVSGGFYGDFDENYMNLIVPQSATNSTSVDGTTVAATNFVAIGTSGYYGAQITLTTSSSIIVTPHTVTSSQPIEVQVYGWGLYDAYSYFGGMTK